jgi:hypothetical protein
MRLSLIRGPPRRGDLSSALNSNPRFLNALPHCRILQISLFPAITFVNFVIPSILVVVAAIVAVAIIVNTCEGFFFVAMPTPEGQLVCVFVFVFHILKFSFFCVSYFQYVKYT